MLQIECRDLSLGYNGKIIAKDIFLCVNKGDFLCIIGDNGTGKSTLVKTLLELVRPMCGKVEFGNGLRRGEIGYMPQQTDIQRDFPASVNEIVLSGCINSMGIRPFYLKEEKKRAKKAMQELGILDIRDRCYRELSGGQQQRVLLARALCATSKLLILDEPAAGLDEKTERELYEHIELINKNEKITVIMVSHDIEASLRYASHILHIGKGEVFFGTKEEYRQRGDKDA